MKSITARHTFGNAETTSPRSGGLVGLICICALMLASCSSEDIAPATDSPVAAQISAGISENATRAIDQKWSSNDAIGVMVTAAANSNMATRYENVKYKIKTLSDEKTADFEAADQTNTSSMIFFQDASETVTFAAYAPYQSSASNALPGTDGVVTGGKTSGMNGSQSDQETIDFIYASGATASKSNPTVSFSGDKEFKHKMARLILNVQMGDGFEASDVSKISAITIKGLKHSGTFNVADGTATATGDEDNTGWDLRASSEDKVVKTEAGNVYTYSMILYPQTLSNALKLTLTADGQAYSNNTTIHPALASGTSYTYTIIVKKTGLVVGNCTIGAWATGIEGKGTAIM